MTKMNKRHYAIVTFLSAFMILFGLNAVKAYAEENRCISNDMLPLICEEIDEELFPEEYLFSETGINCSPYYLNDTNQDNDSDISVYMSYDAAPDCTKDYGYNDLSDGMKAAYKDFCALAYLYSESDDLKNSDYTVDGNYAIVGRLTKAAADYNLKSEDMFKVYFAVRNNYPEYYWMSNYAATSGGKLLLNIDKTYAKASVRNAVENAISEGLSEYLSAMEEASGIYEKVLIAHNMLIDNVEYAYIPNTENPMDENWAHSVSGAFYNFSKNEGCEVVCEGYAKTIQLVLNAAGIENVYVIGQAGGAHAWNNIKINGAYLGLDATWDDYGKEDILGHGYDYFCVPAKYFTNHVPDSKSMNGYSFPQLSNVESYTYYNYYGTNIIGINDASEIRSKLLAASLKVPDDCLVILFDDNNVRKLLEVVPFKYYHSSLMGYKVSIEKNILKTVSKPASAIKLSVTGASITSDAEKKLTVTAQLTPNDSDDSVIWSISDDEAALVKTSDNGKKAVFDFRKNGEFTITARAYKGDVSESVSVKVENITPKDSIPDKSVIWINGGTIKIPNSKDKNSMKTASWNAGFSASDIITRDSKGKEKKKAGKLIVAVTLTESKPEIINGKVAKDTEALKIAKASIKKGTVVVSAAKNEGRVYVWVLDTGDARKYSCNAIEVKLASSKIEAYADRELSVKYKTKSLPIGSSTVVYIKVPDSKDGIHPSSCTFDFSVEDKYKDFISVRETSSGNGDYAIQVFANGIDKKKDGKTAKAVVTVYCCESMKKINLGFTIVNPLVDVEIESENEKVKTSPEDGLVINSEGKPFSVKLNVTEIPAGEEFKPTAKTKVYVIDSPNAVTADKNGKIKAEKTNDPILKKIKVSYKDMLELSFKKENAGSEIKFFLAFAGASGGEVPIVPVTIK